MTTPTKLPDRECGQGPPGSTPLSHNSTRPLRSGFSDDGTCDRADYYADKERGTTEGLLLFVKYVVPALLLFAAAVIVAQHVGWID